MANQKPLLLSFHSFIHLLLLICTVSCEGEEVPVGVILDMTSSVGKIAKSCISMAKYDFYALNPHYRTRVNLIFRDSQNDVISAANAAVDLLKNEQVHAIIGPQRTSEAKFVISLAEKARVPIISFSATSATLSPSTSNYFVRTSYNDSFQVQALVAVIQNYGWREVICIYEDTDYGKGLVPYLNNALQGVNTIVLNTSIISPNAKDAEIFQELGWLKKGQQSTIFVVHMTSSLGSRLFVQAHKQNMMSEGFAWIVTQGLSNLLDPTDRRRSHVMEYVLGVRPHIPKSMKRKHFESRWINNTTTPCGSMERLNLFGLWAYDTVWALAMAVEKAGKGNHVFGKQNANRSSIDVETLGRSEMGPKILNKLQSTKFEGLSGNFRLVDREVESFQFEIFNVIGNFEKIIGYWTPNKGLSMDLNNQNNSDDKAIIISDNSKNKSKLKQPYWPGDTCRQPKRWRIGVPVRGGFPNFVNIEEDSHRVTGFSIEVFRAAVELLEFPFPYEFIPYGENRTMTGSYNELLKEIKKGTFDAVVGDMTIVANRTIYVDFTLPYLESGVAMVVSVKDDEKENFWIFVKPFSWDLWLTTVVAFIFTGLVVWVLEHRINVEFRGPPEYQLGTVLWFIFSTLQFAHREKVINNLSRIVLIVWFFVALILTQSYTASLTSMLTVKHMHPAFADVKEIQSRGYNVGYPNNSFVKDLLTMQLGFNEKKLIAYNNLEEYHKALSQKDVVAIFDEIPYMRNFLSKYCSNYTMVGQNFTTGGLGFAFRQGSPLVAYFSRAILNVTQDNGWITKIEKSTIYSETACEDHGPKLSSYSSLSVKSFGGLFIITGVSTVSALLIYIFMFVHSHWPALNNSTASERSLWSKIVKLVKHFDKKDLSSHTFKRGTSMVHPMEQADNEMPNQSRDSNESENMENHSTDPDESIEDDLVRNDSDKTYPSIQVNTAIDAPHT